MRKTLAVALAAVLFFSGIAIGSKNFPGWSTIHLKGKTELAFFEIDIKVWNPRHDPHLDAFFSALRLLDGLSDYIEGAMGTITESTLTCDGLLKFDHENFCDVPL